MPVPRTRSIQIILPAGTTKLNWEYKTWENFLPHSLVSRLERIITTGFSPGIQLEMHGHLQPKPFQPVILIFRQAHWAMEIYSYGWMHPTQTAMGITQTSPLEELSISGGISQGQRDMLEMAMARF